MIPGLIVPDFDEELHAFTYQGKPRANVTGVLKSAGVGFKPNENGFEIDPGVLEAAATASLGPFEDGRTRAVELFEQALRNAAPAIIAEIEELRRDKARHEQALKNIADIGGNLPDERLLARTGPNDAAQRGLMYVTARGLAISAMPQPAPADYEGAPHA